LYQKWLLSWQKVRFLTFLDRETTWSNPWNILKLPALVGLLSEFVRQISQLRHLMAAKLRQVDVVTHHTLSGGREWLREPGNLTAQLANLGVTAGWLKGNDWGISPTKWTCSMVSYVKWSTFIILGNLIYWIYHDLTNSNDLQGSPPFKSFPRGSLQMLRSTRSRRKNMMRRAN
jgi:hypothetical protein